MSGRASGRVGEWAGGRADTALGEPRTWFGGGRSILWKGSSKTRTHAHTRAHTRTHTHTHAHTHIHTHIYISKTCSCDATTSEPFSWGQRVLDSLSAPLMDGSTPGRPPP